MPIATPPWDRVPHSDLRDYHSSFARATPAAQLGQRFGPSPGYRTRAARRVLHTWKTDHDHAVGEHVVNVIAPLAGAAGRRALEDELLGHCRDSHQATERQLEPSIWPARVRMTQHLFTNEGILRTVDHDAVARLDHLGGLYLPPWLRNASILGGFSASRACPPAR